MNITLLDGSIGQELVLRAKTTPTGLWSTQVMIESPELISEIHDDYFLAGADVASTNSYGLHRDRLSRNGIEDMFDKLLDSAGELAVRSRDAFGSGQVAGAIGPAGWSYRPSEAPQEEQAAELYAEMVNKLSAHADFILFETMSSLREAKGALMGGTVVAKPVWLSLSVDDGDGSKLRSGEPLQEIQALLEEYQPAAVLLNCSVPEAVSTALPILMAAKPGAMPLGAYANGFKKISKEFVEGDDAVVDSLQAREDLDPGAYADFAGQWIAGGAEVVGGCCEVGPAHIAELASRFK